MTPPVYNLKQYLHTFSIKYFIATKNSFFFTIRFCVLALFQRLYKPYDVIKTKVINNPFEEHFNNNKKGSYVDYTREKFRTFLHTLT